MESSQSKGSLPPAWVSLLRLVHPFPSRVVAGVTVAFVRLADSSPGVRLSLTLGLGMLCLQFAIGMLNDLIDVEDDRANKPWKALARGLVPLAGAKAVMGALIVTGLVLAGTHGTASLAIATAGLACGVAYDLRLKRTRWSWLPFALAFPLIPLWAFVAADTWSMLLWWTLPLGGALGFALHLANQAPDIAAEADIRGAAHRMGAGRARWTAIGVFGGAAVVAAIALAGAGEEGRALLALAVAGVAAVAAPLAGRVTHDGMFGVLALGAAGVGVIFLSAA